MALPLMDVVILKREGKTENVGWMLDLGLLYKQSCSIAFIAPTVHRGFLTQAVSQRIYKRFHRLILRLLLNEFRPISNKLVAITCFECLKSME